MHDSNVSLEICFFHIFSLIIFDLRRDDLSRMRLFIMCIT